MQNVDSVEVFFCCAAGFVNSILLLKQFRSGNYSFGHVIDFASWLHECQKGYRLWAFSILSGIHKHLACIMSRPCLWGFFILFTVHQCHILLFFYRTVTALFHTMNANDDYGCQARYSVNNSLNFSPFFTQNYHIALNLGTYCTSHINLSWCFYLSLTVLDPHSLIWKNAAHTFIFGWTIHSKSKYLFSKCSKM